MKNKKLLVVFLSALTSISSCGLNTTGNVLRFYDYSGNIYKTYLIENGNNFIFNDVSKNPDNAQYTYNFDGWRAKNSANNIGTLTTINNGTKIVVNESQEFFPVIKSSLNSYDVLFTDLDGKVIQTTKVEYGKSAVFTGTEPSKAGDIHYYYTFAGWQKTNGPEDSTLDNITGKTTFAPLFTQNIHQYVVTYKNYNGDDLGNKNVDYGEDATSLISKPEKTSPFHTFKFDSWSPSISKVEKVTTTYATYKSDTVKDKPLSVKAGGSISVVSSDTYDYFIGSGYDGESGKIDYNTPRYTDKIAMTSYSYSENSGIGYKDNNLYTWGKNTTYTGSTNSNIALSEAGVVTDAACADEQFIAIAGKRIYTWGVNSYGANGTTNTTSASKPAVISIKKLVEGIETEIDFAYCGVSDGSSYAISTDGTLYASGLNSSGQLGIGTKTNTTAFTSVVGTTKFKNVQAHSTYALAMSTSGVLYFAGTLNGKSSNTFVTINSVFNDIPISIKTYSSSNNHILMLDYSGKMYSVGLNTFGQLGTKDKLAYDNTQLVMEDTTFVSIACGTNYSLAVSSDNFVYCFGSNSNGQLGVGNKIDQITPVAL